jgi:hypothetical protein
MSRFLLTCILVPLFLTSAGATPPLSAHSVFDAGCDSTVNLQEGGGPMEFVRVRNQGTENECYAEVGAQMVDAWRFSNGDTNTAHQTSGYVLALDSAIDFYGTGLPRPDGVVDEGQPCQALRAARLNGSCDDRAVVDSLGSGDIGAAVREFRRYYDEYHVWRDSRSGLRAGLEAITAAPGALSVGEGVACQVSDRLDSLGLPSSMRPNADAILNLLESDSPLVYLRGLMANACIGSHVIRPSIPMCDMSPQINSEDAYRSMRRTVVDRRQPVGIAFCSGMIGTGRAFESGTMGGLPVSSLPAAARSVAGSVCRRHIALVIGVRRHPTTQKCQLLIRNSWGPSFGASADWELAPNGSVWVDAQNLAYSTYSTFSFR